MRSSLALILCFCLPLSLMSLDQLNITHSPYRESMMGTLSFKFSLNGKVFKEHVVFAMTKRAHEISRFIGNLCRNISEDPKEGLPSYKNSPAYSWEQGKYFEIGKILKNQNLEDASSSGESVAENNTFVYRDDRSTISAGKIRTSHEGSVISMVLDEEEFQKGLQDGSFPLNSRIMISNTSMKEFDQKNIVFGFLIGGGKVLDTLLSEKLLGKMSPDHIKIETCYDPEFNRSNNDM